MELKKKFKISIIGHRGFKKAYPENTLLSFQKAIEAKADYVEFDVHYTADNEIVVCHDGNTGRTGNQAMIIKDTPFATLRTLDMGQGQKIPTLQEVFDVCKGKIGCQIEIKAKGLAEPVVKLIEKNNMVADCAISSFQHEELVRVKEVNPKILCASLEPVKSTLLKAIFARGSFIKEAQRLKADAIHPLAAYVNKAFVAKAHAASFLVNPWTVDDPSVWQKLIDAGVDGIITNDPLGLYQFLEKQAK